MSRQTREALDTVWEFLAFLLTALTFLIVGLAIAPATLVNAAVPIAWGFLRPSSSAEPSSSTRCWVERPRCCRAGRTLPLPWLHVLFWAGLRGAVATALALSLPADTPNRELLTGTIYGIVLLTLLIQGTTASYVVARVGLKKPAAD